MKIQPILRISLFSVFLAAFAAPAAAKPLQIWVSSQADVQYYENMAKVYKEKVDKNFDAEFQAFGFTEMPDKLALAIKSGINPPDIVQFDEIYFSLYLKGEVPFVDLTDRIAKSPLKTGILPQRTGLFTWQGRTYGVPQSTSTVVLWYREDLFRDLGITPNDIRTWDKFEAVGRKVRTDSRSLIALDWSYLGILLRQRGYDFYDASGKPLQDSAAIVDTWKRLVKWNDQGIGRAPGRSSIFDPKFFETEVAGNGVLTIMSPDWYGLDMIENMDKGHAGKWRAMPLPIWTDTLSKSRRNTSSFSGQGLVIFKKSQQVDASWKFIEWVMTDVDANVERYLQGNSFTAYTPAWVDQRLSRKDPFLSNQVLPDLLIDLAPKQPYTVQSPYNALIVNFLREQSFGATINGPAENHTTPEQAFSDMRAQIRQMSAGKK